MSDPAPTLIEGLNLEAFERTVYTRDGSPAAFEKCAQDLFAILQQIRKGSGFFGVPEETLPILHTRLAGAVTALFCDPRFHISQDGFVPLCAEHVTLHAIFRASSYATMDHILGVIGTRAEADPTQVSFSNDRLLSLLLCWSLESEVQIDFDVMFAAVPEATHAAIIGMLAVGVTHSEKAYQRRLWLMGMHHILRARPLPERLVLAAGDLYFHCTYTDAPDKHEAKKTVNQWMRDLVLSKTTIAERDRTVIRKERPTIVVPVEWFGTHHAMFRCYAPSLRQLRERFRLVCVYRDNEVDAEALSVFDKAVKLHGDSVAISTILEVVRAEEPDIMFYPSVGMAAWYIALSNIRMAPIQIACPGHPASTFSPVIDYLVCEGDLFGNREKYSEKLVSLPIGSARYISRDGFVGAAKADRPDRTRVAIPAMATKVIPPFLRVLEEIQAACRDIEFHFFPNMVGMSHYICQKDLRKWFPDAVVHPRTTYQEYMDNLAACSIALSTFPFGGTNSVIDCFLAGVPVITLEGDEIHQRSDASMIRRMKIPEFACVASDVDGYVRAARVNIAHRLIDPMPYPEQVESEFFGPGPQEIRGEFLAAFLKIYDEACNDQ